jgi:two-component system, NtrC family, response regulator HydG
MASGSGGGDRRGEARDPSEEIATKARVLDAGEPRPLHALRAVVIEGADAGRSFLLDPACPSRILVGTGAACDVRLTDTTVSRRHLAFEPSGQRYRVTDLGSTNGTFVDGVAVSDGFVRGGEVVRCGGIAMRLDEDLSTAPRATPSSAMGFGRFVGASDAMRRLYPLCERLAGAILPVLIEGETGTGKEVLAEAIHEVSGRKGAYLVFDCTAISPSLVESELFGHERGAFTGATTARPGLLEEADGGTLLIDEIGDLDPSLQPKLLRALDRGEFRRVGGRQMLRSDVRFLAATRRDLDREVEAGRFRDDLLHRLAVGRIELPPLRDRKGDVRLLARHFAEELGAAPDALSPALLARLEDYPWPGNVRELRNTIARQLVFGESAPVGTNVPSAAAIEIPPADAGDASFIDALVTSGLPFPVARRRLVEEFERRFIERVLAAHDGNVTHAAAASGIATRYFRLIKARHGRDPESVR